VEAEGSSEMLAPIKLYSVTSQKTIFFIATAVRTSDLILIKSAVPVLFVTDPSEYELRGPYTINHVAQHCVLCNMVDRVWC
jgi:hypothetical protein